jgi:hypothetical protein
LAETVGSFKVNKHEVNNGHSESLSIGVANSLISSDFGYSLTGTEMEDVDCLEDLEVHDGNPRKMHTESTKAHVPSENVESFSSSKSLFLYYAFLIFSYFFHLSTSVPCFSHLRPVEHPLTLGPL